MKYFYESHLGGIYSSDYPLEHEDLYCDQCGDSDWLIASIRTGCDLLWFIVDLQQECYGIEYIREIIAREYPLLDIKIPNIDEYKANIPDRDDVYCDPYCDECFYMAGHNEHYPSCVGCTQTYEYALFTSNPPELWEMKLD